MFLIMSGAYVGQELESEFGRIPPSFLPLGNRPLFQHQVALAPQGVHPCPSRLPSQKSTVSGLNSIR